MAKKENRYLLKRGGRWHYSRRPPTRFRHLETREYVRVSLRTTSLEIARMRRDALEVADNEYWQALALEDDISGGLSEARQKTEYKRHKSACARAVSLGFIYKRADEIVQSVATEEILERISILEKNTGKNLVAPETVADALLGGVKEPEIGGHTISNAFKIYLEEIVFSELFNKSPTQQKAWTKTKQTSLDYFVKIMGDMPMNKIERKDALKYKKWWMERMLPTDSKQSAIQPNTANRHVGNIRQLYESYFTHYGEEERPNPFRNIYFRGDVRSRVQSFDDEWIRNKILIPGLFDALHKELKCLIYILIETGARMSEVINLEPEDIHLNAEIPYISISPKTNRQLKTPSSERDIPLVGVALESIKMVPAGFPKYKGKNALVSANLMKAFQNRKLFPTKDHVIYSFRHSFEKRMQEANIDYGLRCILMGHKNDRPSYGDGGSIRYRRDELLKIAHSFPAEIFVN